MKNLILTLVLLLIPSSASCWWLISSQEVATPSANCITLGGNLLQESFDSTGYDDGDWAEDPNNPDEDNTDTLTNAPCFTGKYLKGSGTDIWARNTFTSSAEIYISFYVYFSAESIASGSDADTGWTESPKLTFQLHDDSGTLSYMFYFATDNGSVTVTLDTQYLVQVRLNDTTNEMDWYVYDKDESLIGSSTAISISASGSFGKLLLGPVNNSESITVYHDLVDISTTGFPTGSPAK